MYYQYIIVKSIQRYWHLSLFLEGKKPESKNDCSFPFASVSYETEPSPLLCRMYIYIIHSVYVYIYVYI